MDQCYKGFRTNGIKDLMVPLGLALNTINVQEALFNPWFTKNGLKEG